MLYYLIAAISPIIAWMFYDSWVKSREISEDKKRRLMKWTAFISILPMFLLFVLRYRTIGADTPGYVTMFETTIRSYSFRDLLNSELMRPEIGFRIYIKIVSLITENYTVFFLINGIVIFGTLLRFSFKYTGNPFVFFALFMALGTYSFVETGLRQALAMTVCLWAVDFIKDKKIFKFALAVIIAYFFHKSAIIFALLYPLRFIKKYKSALLSYFLILIIFSVGFSTFQEWFNELLGYEYTIEETGNGGIFLLLTIFICVYSSIILSYKEKDQIDSGNYVIMHMAFMTVVFWFLRLISRTAERISYYFIFGLYAQFAEAASHKDTKATFGMKVAIIFVCVVLFVYRTLGTHYLFFWAR